MSQIELINIIEQYISGLISLSEFAAVIKDVPQQQLDAANALVFAVQF